MNLTQVQTSQSSVVYANKAELAAANTSFAILGVEEDEYNGKPQWKLAIVDLDGENEAILTLGAGGSRDEDVKSIIGALESGAEAVGPFVLTSFPTRFGKPGYRLANA